MAEQVLANAAPAAKNSGHPLPPALPRRGQAVPDPLSDVDDAPPHQEPRGAAPAPPKAPAHPPAPPPAPSAHDKEARGAAPAAQGKGFSIDMETCRKTFDAFDRDKSGYLDLEELTKLAEALWNSSHPDGPKLDRENRAVGTHPCALSCSCGSWGGERVKRVMPLNLTPARPRAVLGERALAGERLQWRRRAFLL